MPAAPVTIDGLQVRPGGAEPAIQRARTLNAFQQRYLASPGGGWSYMEDRGSATANHMDHPHVNYRG